MKQPLRPHDTTQSHVGTHIEQTHPHGFSTDAEGSYAAPHKSSVALITTERLVKMVRAAGVTLEDFGRLANEEVVSLSRKRKIGDWRESRIEREWIDYTDTLQTNTMRDAMRRISTWLERASIRFIDDGGTPLTFTIGPATPFRDPRGRTPWGNASISAGVSSVGFWQPPLFPCSHSARSPRVSCSNVD
jgi:hypothetical protein